MCSTRSATTPVLDCSSVERAARSLGELLGLSYRQFVARVRAAEVDWDSDSITPENQVAIQLGFDRDESVQPCTVRWFHATRAISGSRFEEGLLPTLEAMPTVWEALGVSAQQWLSAAQWQDYQSSFNRGDRKYSHQFRSKRQVPHWEGPFAFLVKDAALGKHREHKNFTALSEVAEDICADFEELYGHPLREEYQKVARSCLVTFTWDGTDFQTIRAAANYVYRSLQGIECGLACNTNFDGGGKPVPFTSIDGVEWL